MLNKKNIIVHLLSLFVLFIGFMLCRYVFFDIHGNIGLPACLFIVGLIPVAISFFFKGKITPICTAFAYIAGFIAGVIFQTDGVDVGGGTTNNLWIIWVVVFVCLTLAGIICEKFIGSVKKATK
ncbi:MAG: hypothetical protein E7624_00535 [Ruminococcaceae bacterium]|nr:hypothetical protein [Oscillospiraceae bacterium]